MARVKVNAIEGVPCASCGVGSLPAVNAVAWIAVAALVGWIFFGTLGMKRPQRES